MKKISEDIYRTQQGKVTKEMPITLYPDTVSFTPLQPPLGINWEDYEWNDLFARSITGTWELTINNKGNLPRLPAIDLIKLEFLHTYFQA
ncbi:hypothetical protein LCGC14_0606640 [marine sediment metagenome]|uniref:Uncharacterized protein n=1 Tax=marine sediment metagenome TaxID=412755 RepID=A0A0F9RDU2_9ZZZZ|nr:hypothetical protein [bacterium]